MGIRVRAKELGYYDHKLRKPKEEFEVQDESELGRWMERLDAPVKKARKRADDEMEVEA